MNGMEPWSEVLRFRWFIALLIASIIGVCVLFSPYLYVLLFAGVTVVVSWPLHAWVARVTRLPNSLAALVSTGLLGALVFLPLAMILALFIVQARAFALVMVDWFQSGEAATLMDAWLLGVSIPDWMASALGLENTDEFTNWQQWVDQLIGSQGELLSGLQDALLATLSSAGSGVSVIAQTLLNISIDAIIFVFGVVTLFAHGENLLVVIHRLSPVDDAYERRLFQVFGEFSRNLVFGSLATAGVQGAMAGVGYFFSGAGNVFVLAIMTAIGSFIPVVGTVVVWAPVAIYLFATGQTGAGAFLTIWSIVVVGGIDNLLKPLFMRGSSDMHPFLVFLAVFGGLYWFGVPGLFIGPVFVAFFLALYEIYLRDVLLIPAEAAPSRNWAFWSASGGTAPERVPGEE